MYNYVAHSEEKVYEARLTGRFREDRPYELAC